jgi:LmbE family N-acetylglucosaminyl deacetylase
VTETETPSVIAFGAHPDDCEVFAGGTAALWAQEGFRVLFVSLTNGDAGHHEMERAGLAERRAREAARSASVIGVDHFVLDHRDGELEADLALRKEVVRLIRDRRAHVVLTHRPWDYHPDHRAAALAVRDASFMVRVPHFCPEASALRYEPVFLSLMDSFAKPYPFSPDIAIDVDAVMPLKWRMLDAMESQFYEWLPWLEGVRGEVPAGAEERLAWLESAWGPFLQAPADRWRDALLRWYGEERGRGVRYAECFEVSEYGRQPDRALWRRLFPFMGGRAF